MFAIFFTYTAHFGFFSMRIQSCKVYVPILSMKSQELFSSGIVKTDSNLCWPSHGLLIVFAGIRSSLAIGAVRPSKSWSSFKIGPTDTAAGNLLGYLAFIGRVSSMISSSRPRPREVMISMTAAFVLGQTRISL